MKKTYKNPTLKVVNVKPATILAGSTPGYGETTTATSGNCGRGSRFSTWEDDAAADYDE